MSAKLNLSNSQLLAITEKLKKAPEIFVSEGKNGDLYIHIQVSNSRPIIKKIENIKVLLNYWQYLEKVLSYIVVSGGEKPETINQKIQKLKETELLPSLLEKVK